MFSYVPRIFLVVLWLVAQIALGLKLKPLIPFYRLLSSKQAENDKEYSEVNIYLYSRRFDQTSIEQKLVKGNKSQPRKCGGWSAGVSLFACGGFGGLGFWGSIWFDLISFWLRRHHHLLLCHYCLLSQLRQGWLVNFQILVYPLLYISRGLTVFVVVVRTHKQPFSLLRSLVCDVPHDFSRRSHYIYISIHTYNR